MRGEQELPRVGQWIWTREWQGPYLEVVGATAKRITCTDHGRRCFIEPRHVICAADTKDIVKQAHDAAKAAWELRAIELATVKDVSRAAKQAVIDLEREIQREADATALAFIAKATPQSEVG